MDEETRAGLLFVSPFLIGFVIFTAGPLLYSLYLSFTAYDVLSPPRWIGLQNYQRMLTDPRFSKTLFNTLYYVALYVPTAIPLAFGLALLLNANVRGLSFWRTAFYLPEITPAVAAGVLWLRILSPQNGLLNQALALIGIAGPAWTIDAQWVKPALVIMRLWAVGWMVVVYLAALQLPGQVERFHRAADLHSELQVAHAAPWVAAAGAAARLWAVSLGAAVRGDGAGHAADDHHLLPGPEAVYPGHRDHRLEGVTAPRAKAPGLLWIDYQCVAIPTQEC
jgi:hypothetical protein